MRALHTKHGETAVYPGHPSIVAYEIMLAFEDDLAKAFAPSYDRDGKKLGWCEALSNSEVSGAGGCVHQGVTLLRRIQDGTLTPLEALDYGDVVWGHSRGWGKQEDGCWLGDYGRSFEEGQEQADRFKAELLERLLKIEVTPRDDLAEYRPALLIQMNRKFARKS